MQPHRNVLSNVLALVTCAAFAVGVPTKAEETKADAAGTWTWSVPARNGGPDRTNTLVLKVEGEKLSGTLTTPRRDASVDTAIQDGKISGEEISFKVTREFNGNSIVSKYSGKVSGDSIKGKVETERDGETQSRDWDAKRSAGVAAKPEKTDAPEKK